MIQEIEKQVKHVEDELRRLSKVQSQNLHSIQKQEKTEVDFLEWKNQSYHLFNRILINWHNDRELGPILNNLYQEAVQIERKLVQELYDEKETLLQKKLNLRTLEDDLNYRRKILNWELNQ